MRSVVRAWRRPTLPGPCGPSTIGAEGLNGRVRDGNAWVPFAIATKRDLELPQVSVLKALRLENWIRTFAIVSLAE